MGRGSADRGRETRLSELPFEYFLKSYFFFADFFFDFFFEGIQYHLHSFFTPGQVLQLRKKAATRRAWQFAQVARLAG